MLFCNIAAKGVAAVQPEYITSRKNPLIAHVRKLTTSRKYRRSCGLFVGDGLKLLQEAVRWNAPLTTVIGTEGQILPPLSEHVRVVTMPEDVMESISPMQSPQGALFICEMPPEQPEELAGDRFLVLDGLQDPGNIGTIWRSADALGADGIILTGDCADPWNHKTVRATMGACFRLPIVEADADTLYQMLQRQSIPLYATALGNDMEDVRTIDLGRCAVVIGSEGSGVSTQLLQRCEKRVSIPMRARCESLNAAAAATVVLWEMARKNHI